jgi:hypothetical protein
LTPVIVALKGIVTDKFIGHAELIDVLGLKEYSVFPFPAVYVTLALPVMEVAFVDPTNVVLDPLQIVTSEPAFTIGGAIPVPLTVIFCEVAPVLETTMGPL